tara:strand:- start:58 stop:249 length:192 start_codon:yes stop_codon:yes gene_type:complete
MGLTRKTKMKSTNLKNISFYLLEFRPVQANWFQGTDTINPTNSNMHDEIYKTIVKTLKVKLLP